MSGAGHNVPGAGITTPPPPNAAELRAPGLTQNVDPDKFFAALPNLNAAAVSKLRLFEVTIGANDGLVTEQHVIEAALKDHGVKAIVVEKPGYIHEWPFWRSALIDLAPRLFQPAR